MVKENLTLLLPEIIVAVAAIIAMLSIAVKRSHRFVSIFTSLALIVAILSLGYVDSGHTQVTTMFLVDGFSLFFTGLILVATLVISIFAFPYFQKEKVKQEEFYVLLLLASLGAIAMTISNNFASFFLSLEVMSVSLYALIAYLKKEQMSIEAGIKYLIMAAVSVGILLFGFALIYAQTGEMQLDKIAGALTSGGTSVLFIAGMALVIAGLGFKLALVPFHFWTPDIYSGSPAPTSAFVATISKGAVFAFLIRFFSDLNGSAHTSVWVAFAVLSIASMLVGNLLALRQQNIKRLLAYSSIGHLGYLIIPLLAASEKGTHAAIFYLVTYFVAMLGAFGVVGFMSRKGQDAYSLEDYRGLYWRKPWIAALMTAIMLSLAGIPLTAGFLGKFYLLMSGVGATLWLLVIVLVVSSGISLFYYLRVVFTMFSRKNQQEYAAFEGKSILGGIVLAALFILLFWLGVFPSGLLDILNHLVGVL